jgi:hypothetical protein
MGMSRQTTLILACTMAVSFVIPGTAGYVSGKLEAIELAQRELRAREALLDARERAAAMRNVSVPAGSCTPQGRRKGKRSVGGRVSRPHRELPAALAPAAGRAGSTGNSG